MKHEGSLLCSQEPILFPCLLCDSFVYAVTVYFRQFCIRCHTLLLLIVLYMPWHCLISNNSVFTVTVYFHQFCICGHSLIFNSSVYSVTALFLAAHCDHFFPYFKINNWKFVADVETLNCIFQRTRWRLSKMLNTFVFVFVCVCVCVCVWRGLMRVFGTCLW